MIARKTMQSLGLMLLMMVMLFLVGSHACAEEALVAVDSVTAAPGSLSEPGEVTIQLTLSNPTDTDMVYPVTLLDPDGNLISSFGDGGSYVLRAHDSYAWEGKWNVTQAQLDAGTIPFTLQYQTEDETGALVTTNLQAAARIEFNGERVELSVDREITPEVVRSGSKVTVKYELYNSGNVDLSSITVTDTVLKNSPKKIASLAAGERATVEFVVSNMRADHTSEGTITYKTVGATKTLTLKVEKATIPVAKANLKVELSSPADGVNVNEPATLVVTFRNEGNISYSNVTVTEEKMGEVASGLEIPAGETVTASKQFILTDPITFKVSATLDDNTGETHTIKADNELKIGVYDPEKNIVLTLNLTSDVSSLASLPMDTRFHLSVTNNSNVKAEDIRIYHGDTYIYTINSLEPDASTMLDWDIRIQHAGEFRFTATAKDGMNNAVSFNSNTLLLEESQATPKPTAAPVVTVAPPVWVTPVPNDPMLDQGRSALLTAAVAFAALLGCALVLFIISTAVRLYKKNKSNAAFDHLDLTSRRDYTATGDESDAALDEPDFGEEEPEEEEELPRKEEMVLPHERLIQEAEDQADDETPSEPIEEEGGYRMSRGDTTPVLTNAPVFTGVDASDEAEASAPAAPVRRRRSQRARRTEDGE